MDPGDPDNLSRGLWHDSDIVNGITPLTTEIRRIMMKSM